ncbi:MAG: hypothetical protein FJX77_18240 [Armatimonadetes bacterium]|nr:hypothetical protein [Armatimonadota bacterium]
MGGELALPHCSAGEEGELLLTWDSAEHHFEFEFVPSRPPELFASNRETGVTWGADQKPGAPFPEEGLRLLEPFVVRPPRVV